jgi:hypothetical protein
MRTQRIRYVIVPLRPITHAHSFILPRQVQASRAGFSPCAGITRQAINGHTGPGHGLSHVQSPQGHNASGNALSCHASVIRQPSARSIVVVITRLIISVYGGCVMRQAMSNVAALGLAADNGQVSIPAMCRDYAQSHNNVCNNVLCHYTASPHSPT